MPLSQDVKFTLSLFLNKIYLRGGEFLPSQDVEFLPTSLLDKSWRTSLLLPGTGSLLLETGPLASETGPL